MDLALNNLQRLVCHKTQTTTINHKIGTCLWARISSEIHYLCIHVVNDIIFIRHWYVFTQPLRMSRMATQDQFFLAKFNWSDFRVFLLDGLNSSPNYLSIGG